MCPCRKSFPEIRSYENLKKLIAVDVTDKAPCVVVGRDVSRILREDISYDLIHGIITLLTKSIVNNGKIFLELSFTVIAYGEGHRLLIIHGGTPFAVLKPLLLVTDLL